MRFGLLEVLILLIVILLIAARIYIPVQIIKREKGIKEERIKTISAIFKQSEVGLTDNQRHVKASVLSSIPAIAKTELVGIQPDKQALFFEEYLRRSKGAFDTYLHWIIVGMHYTYLGKDRLQWFYWLTLGGLLIWAIVDLFRIPRMVNEYNSNLAVNITKNLNRNPDLEA